MGCPKSHTWNNTYYCVVIAKLDQRFAEIYELLTERRVEYQYSTQRRDWFQTPAKSRTRPRCIQMSCEMQIVRSVTRCGKIPNRGERSVWPHSLRHPISQTQISCASQSQIRRQYEIVQSGFHVIKDFILEYDLQFDLHGETTRWRHLAMMHSQESGETCKTPKWLRIAN